MLTSGIKRPAVIPIMIANLDKDRSDAIRKLIVALDFGSADLARELTSVLHGRVGTFKIGLELIYSGGLPFAQVLVQSGYEVFLDAKLLDIPNTVERATANAAELGASFLTVHGMDRKTLDAAVRGRGAGWMKLLAVTVLTSLDTADLADQGIGLSSTELVLRRAHFAIQAGFDGVVASAHEAKTIRSELGSDFLIVTPGIRPAGAAPGDQSRIATPADAITAGASHIVVGRPITAASDPRQATENILQEIEATLKS